MKASKKLIASLFALVVAVSLAATTTYAWFTMNPVVNVGNFDVTVTSVTPGLFVSTKEGVGYTSSLELGAYIQEALDDYKSKNSNADFRMSDITWDETKMTDEAGATTNYTHDMTKEYNATTATKGYTVLAAGTTTIGTPGVAYVRTQTFEYNMQNGYLSFNLYFRGDGEYDIRLTNNSKVTPVGADRPATVNAYPWKDLSALAAVYGTAIEDADSTTETPLETRAANAARVMFNTMPGLVADAGTPVNHIWEPNATEGFSEHRAGADTPTGSGVRNLAQDVKAILFGETIDANLTTDITPRFPIYEPTILDTQIATATHTAAVGDITSPVLVTLAQASGGTGAYYCKMTVSVWIEGWDEDCLNSILTDAFKVALEVKAFAV